MMAEARVTFAAPLDLEDCLVMWGNWERGYRMGPGAVRVATWRQQVGEAARADATATSHLTSSGLYIVQHVSKGIEALPVREWQIMLDITYVMNGRARPAVWSRNRLPREAISLAILLEEAKQALVPILRGRGLPV